MSLDGPVPATAERAGRRAPARRRIAAEEMAIGLIAEHSYLWIGIERTTIPGRGTVTTGEHMYVEYFVPADVRHPEPIVFVHGGGGQAVAFLGRGEGRRGWLHHALDAGYTVYLVDRPGYGRNPPHPLLVGPQNEPTPHEVMTPLFSFAAAGGRWDGTGEVGDPGVDEFMAQQRPMRFDSAAHIQAVTQARAAQLLDRIGPSIVITHSAGGPFGWLAADARPSLVRALVSAEGLGPATLAVPLTFDPPVSRVDELDVEPLPARPDVDWGSLGGVPRTIQREPARRLVNLAQVPIAVLASEDPRFSVLAQDAVDFLRQGGCTVEHLRLAEHGIRGNGHMMLLEENNAEVLDVALAWLERTVG
jgi:pimeloyl-ACP methyl ester carboxylesterase